MELTGQLPGKVAQGVSPIGLTRTAGDFALIVVDYRPHLDVLSDPVHPDLQHKIPQPAADSQAALEPGHELLAL